MGNARLVTVSTIKLSFSYFMRLSCTLAPFALSRHETRLSVRVGTSNVSGKNLAHQDSDAFKVSVPHGQKVGRRFRKRSFSLTLDLVKLHWVNPVKFFQVSVFPLHCVVSVHNVLFLIWEVCKFVFHWNYLRILVLFCENSVGLPCASFQDFGAARQVTTFTFFSRFDCPTGPVCHHCYELFAGLTSTLLWATSAGRCWLLFEALARCRQLYTSAICSDRNARFTHWL